MLAYLIGGPVGLLAGYSNGRGIDLFVVGLTDLFLAFPQLILVLILLAATGPSLVIVVVGIAIGHVPRILRIVRSATIEVRTLEFVEAAVARGESQASILLRDLLPNISSPLLADFGLRLTFSILAYSALAYLGLAQPPPAADWGLLISENRIGIAVQPLAVLVPAAIIAALANGINLMSDAIARSLGQSPTDGGA
jgi:peptide/nickel transport system permease protein